VQPPWLYCSDLQTGTLTLPEAQARHARLSLRLRPGDAVVLFDGRGRTARAAIAADEPAAAGAKPAARRRGRAGGPIIAVEAISDIPAPARTLTIIVGGCKGTRLDWMVEKCTELGVTGLIFAGFERSVVRVGSGHLEKLRRLCIEACKQCGRAWLPEISAVSALDQAIAQVAGAVLLLADLSPTAEPLATALQRHSCSPRIVAVVGPEGGLTEKEHSLLRDCGAQPVRLAQHVLRVETAAVALAAGFAAIQPPPAHPPAAR